MKLSNPSFFPSYGPVVNPVGLYLIRVSLCEAVVKICNWALHLP